MQHNYQEKENQLKISQNLSKKMLLISRYITSTPAAKHQELCMIGLWSSFDKNDKRNDIGNHKGKHIDKYKINHIHSFPLI